jgi:hypothetical protein
VQIIIWQWLFGGLFNDAVSSLTNDRKTDELEMKWSWYKRGTIQASARRGRGKHEILSQDSWNPGQDYLPSTSQKHYCYTNLLGLAMEFAYLCYYYLFIDWFTVFVCNTVLIN